MALYKLRIIIIIIIIIIIMTMTMMMMLTIGQNDNLLFATKQHYTGADARGDRGDYIHPWERKRYIFI